MAGAPIGPTLFGLDPDPRWSPEEAVRPQRPDWILRFTVPGKPVSKGRPHVFTRKLKDGRSFTKAVTPERTIVYENWIRECALGAMRDSAWEASSFPLDCPLVLRATFYVERPKKPSWAAPAGRSDLDNYLKALVDGMQLARVYVDDARIVHFDVTKLWTEPDGEGPRAEVELREWRP